MTTKAQTVVPGASDVELLNVQITSKSDLEINDYTVSFIDGDFAAGSCSTD
jgi:hypothetical protein